MHIRSIAIALTSIGASVATLSCSKDGQNDTERSPRQSAETLGVHLPPSASDIRFSDRAGMFGGDYYVSAVISRGDFQRIVSQLGLRHRSDLLEYWPGALTAHDTPWWTVSSVNDSDTYFGDSVESTYIVARYEGGRIFLKYHVY